MSLVRCITLWAWFLFSFILVWQEKSWEAENNAIEFFLKTLWITDNCTLYVEEGDKSLKHGSLPKIYEMGYYKFLCKGMWEYISC